jgi:hypothetical protein
MSGENHTTDGGADGIGRRGFLKGAAAMSAMPVLAGAAGTAGGAPSTAPTGVHVALGNPAHRELRVGWTATPVDTGIVEYRRAGGTRWRTVGAATKPVPGENVAVYTARLDGLDPDTEYEYRAVLGDTRSQISTTSTAPKPGDSGRLTVTAVGDQGIADENNAAQRASNDDPERVIGIAKNIDPAFHLGVGDISYANGRPETWELYFSEFEYMYSETPFMTAVGNHEVEPGTGLTQYDRRLNDLMPVDNPGRPQLESKQRWYAFQYGDTLFMSLNTSTDSCPGTTRAAETVPTLDPTCQTEVQEGIDLPPGPERTIEKPLEQNLSERAQTEFIEETLRRAERDPTVKWKVVYCHGPLWTSSPTHPDRRDLRRLWGEYFHEYNVDIVLHGDNHVYERTKPIGPGNEVREMGESGTTYVTNGTGGTSHYELEPEPEFTAFRDNDHFGVTELSFGTDLLVVEYVAFSPEETGPADPTDVTGRTVDTLTIGKDADGRPLPLDS